MMQKALLMWWQPCPHQHHYSECRALGKPRQRTGTWSPLQYHTSNLHYYQVYWVRDHPQVMDTAEHCPSPRTALQDQQHLAIIGEIYEQSCKDCMCKIYTNILNYTQSFWKRSNCSKLCTYCRKHVLLIVNKGQHVGLESYAYLHKVLKNFLASAFKFKVNHHSGTMNVEHNV